MRGRWQPLSPIQQGRPFTLWWRRHQTNAFANAAVPVVALGPAARGSHLSSLPGADTPQPRPDPTASGEPRRLPADEVRDLQCLDSGQRSPGLPPAERASQGSEENSPWPV